VGDPQRQEFLTVQRGVARALGRESNPTSEEGGASDAYHRKAVDLNPIHLPLPPAQHLRQDRLTSP